jgi:hypothetical protein
LTEKYHKGIELTVMESEPDKVGTGYVSISREVMNELGLVPGDVIEITGKKITHALVWPFRYDKDKTIICMDGTIRKNAGVSLGDIVTVRPAKLKQATRIILAPLNQSIPSEFISYLKVRLMERQFYNPRPVTKGDIINVSIGIGGVFSLIVISVTPEHAGIVTDSTEIIIREEAVKEEALQILMTPSIKKFGSKDILEDVVANVLEALGFSVRVDHKVLSRAGTEVEIDVLGEKIVGDIKFIVYASCKNWDKPVEIGVVREELGRIHQMLLTPHVRVLVANSFTDSARREAIADGFVPIEIGEKVHEVNAEKAYLKVYEKLNKLFTGVAPKWMQDLAEKVKKIAEEIKRIGEELEKARGTYKF